ncbi:MAG: ABC transporter substrate-binding protein [Desulfobacterium sp.]|nr:ABC transporter substrate-binding protein [Desulfobacterium sp.]
MFRKSLFVSLIVLALIYTGVTAAGAEESPGAVLKRSIDNAIIILNQPVEPVQEALDERNQRLFEMAAEVFDFPSLTMGALGSNWRRFNRAERNEFIDLFSHVVANSYFSQMEGQDFSNVVIDFGETKMLQSTSSGVRRADIESIVTHNGTKTPVVYRMLEKNNTWKVYDVIIENVSMVSNYREQYKARFMDTPQKMIAELKEKLNR